MKTLGSTLKALREEKDISMDEMANQLKEFGVCPSKSMISRWENSKAEPSMEYARILAKYFSKTLDFLLGLEVDEFETIAAHHDGDEWTEEELEEIEQFKEFVKLRKAAKKESKKI